MKLYCLVRAKDIELSAEGEKMNLIPQEVIGKENFLISIEKVALMLTWQSFMVFPQKRWNQAVRRNKACRFPEDFMFQLTRQERRGGHKL